MPLILLFFFSLTDVLSHAASHSSFGFYSVLCFFLMFSLGKKKVAEDDAHQYERTQRRRVRERAFSAQHIRSQCAHMLKVVGLFKQKVFFF